MKPEFSKLSEPSRDDLIQAISHAMLFQGKRRQHHWDGLNAKVAAEKLIDGLASANYVILRGPPAPPTSRPRARPPGPTPPTSDPAPRRTAPVFA